MVSNCLVSVLVLAGTLYSQTECGIAHTQPGIFICYPNPAVNASDRDIPDLFHFSAQVNASSGRVIMQYSVLMDGRRIYRNRLALPVPRLSIETNIQAPLSPGSHTLTLLIDAAGRAEVADIHIHPAAWLGFCDTFSRVEARACVPMLNNTPLHWTATPSTQSESPPTFPALLAYYTRNLERLEADTADALALDGDGNLFSATHASSNLEVRKYLPNGSLAYDHLIQLCGNGYSSVTGLAIAQKGRVWLAGNTTACLSTTPDAAVAKVRDNGRPHGFLMLLDTTKTDASSLVYASWIAPVENETRALRLDESGNVYVAGDTAAPEFPHQTTLHLSGSNTSSTAGFVSVFQASGAPLASTLLPDVQLAALSTETAGILYVGGSAGQTALVAGLSDSARHLVYEARVGKSGLQQVRAIEAIEKDGHTRVLAAGVGAHPFLAALEPCRKGRIESQTVLDDASTDTAEIAWQPALDAFARWFAKSSDVAGAGRKSTLQAAVDTAPPCGSAPPQ